MTWPCTAVSPKSQGSGTQLWCLQLAVSNAVHCQLTACFYPPKHCSCGAVACRLECCLHL